MIAASSPPLTKDSQPALTARLARRARRPALLGELLVVAILVFSYDRICGLAQTREALAVRDGQQVLDVERRLRLDFELASNLWLAAHSQLASFASWYYQLAHLTVTLVVLLVCYLTRPDIYRAARNALVAINALALIVFWTYPVAPPRLLPGEPFVDVAQTTGVAAASAATSAPDPYAAMPSLHTGWAVWVAVVGCVLVRRWWARLLISLYPLVTVAVIVTTGNHYVLDAVAGAAVAGIAIGVVGLTSRSLRLRAGGFGRSPDSVASL